MADSTDILQDIPLPELPLLIDLIQSRLGRSDSTFMVNFIKNAIDWLTRFPNDSYIVLMAPHGDWKSHCTFIADLNMPNQAAMVIFSLEESNEQLLNGLLRTKRIDWSRPILFAMVAQCNYPVIYRSVEELNLDLDDDTSPCYIFRMDSEDVVKFEYTCPDNIKIDQLLTSHSDIVNNEWPHKYKGSEKYMKAIIARNDSVALFIEDSGELVSWAFVNFLGALATLQTIPAHKRKGFGTLVTKAMSVKMAAKGMDPFGTVLTYNEASKKLLYSLGFKPQSNEATFFISKGKIK